MFETTKLATMNEQVRDHVELESLSDYFLKKFSYCVKKNDWLERFGSIVQCLIWFGDNNSCRYLEVVWPMT